MPISDRGLRVDTCLKEPLYYGNEICRRTFNFDCLVVSAPGKGAREEPKVVEKVTPLPVALDPRLRVSKNQALLHERERAKGQ